MRSSAAVMHAARAAFGVVWLFVAAVAAGCARSPSAGRSGRQGLRECSSAVREAYQADTVNLMRREVEALSIHSAEGVTVVEHRDGTQRRVLSATYLGETGRIRYRFSFAAPDSYLLGVLDENYAEPLPATPAAILSRSERWLIVCAGNLVESGDDSTLLVEASQVLAEADSLIRAHFGPVR